MSNENKGGGIDTLVGFTFGDWLRVVKENRFALSWPYRRQWLLATLLSIRNSRLRKKEMARFGRQIEEAIVRPPLFVVGHWRSGTTLLHSLLAVDEQFAYPNQFQVTFPHIFLSLAEVVQKQLADADAEKRPMDNVEVRYDSPGEDEFALAVLSLRSPVLGWMFPRRAEFYDRYLTFRDVPADEVEAWRQAFLFFLQKLSCCHEKRLVLKSPQHTARIRLLLEMFPDAHFVHIHRHPYQVFRSTQKLYRTAVARIRVQTASDDHLDEDIIRRYREMYDAYLAERELIPPGHLHELSFEDLEQDMVGQVREIYEHLSLGSFAAVEPKLRQYVESMAGYQKNPHQPLPDDVKQRLFTAWQPMFEAFGYEA